MFFPLAFSFVLLKRNNHRRIWLLAGLSPSLYGVFAVLFDIGDILQKQSFYIPDGDIYQYLIMAQGIYSHAGTVGTKPFMDIYLAYAAGYGTRGGFSAILVYLGMLGVLLFLWYIIGLIRKAIIRIFKQNGDERLVLISGILSLFGVVVIAPFNISWFDIRTLFLYWIVIGFLGGIVKKRA